MGCFIVLFGAIWPRVMLILLWLFSGYPQRAFHGMLWPLLGFFFLPATTLGYELAKNWNPGGRLEGWWIVLPALGLLHDFGHWGFAGSRRRTAS